MKIHEYQGKEILRGFGVPTPRGVACFNVEEAVAAAQKLGGKVWVVKAQIHAGGRGKGGGVKVAKSLDEVRQFAGQILGMHLITHQTGPEGQVVRRLLIEEGAAIAKSFTLAWWWTVLHNVWRYLLPVRAGWRSKKLPSTLPRKSAQFVSIGHRFNDRRSC